MTIQGGCGRLLPEVALTPSSGTSQGPPPLWWQPVTQGEEPSGPSQLEQRREGKAHHLLRPGPQRSDFGTHWVDPTGGHSLIGPEQGRHLQATAGCFPSGPFLVFWLYHVACGILVPGSGIEPVPPAVRAQSLNHWAAREVPR